MLGGHGKRGLHLTGTDHGIGSDNAQHGGQLRGDHARPLDHAADLPAVGTGQFDRLRLGIRGHDGVGCISSGLGGAGKSSISGFGTGQNVIQGQQLADQTSGAHSNILCLCADEFGDRLGGEHGLLISRLTGAGVGTAGVENHGFGVAVRHGFAAPLHRGCTESVRREHAGHRVKRAVVDHESEILLAFNR